MAAYKDLVGQKVTVVTSNPPEPKTGQMWYNSTDGKLRGLGKIASATSQPGVTRSSPTAVQMASASGGPSDANWVAGGNTYVNTTEEWNGSGWSNGGNLNVSGLNRSGFGTLTAGVCVGGMTPTPAATNATEHYNGTSWSAVNAMPEALRGLCGGGTQTAAIMYSGHGNPSLYSVASDKTKYYDGTNWSVQPATMNTARANMSGCGIQTAALGVSGENGPVGTPAQSMVEEYNGSTWSTAPTLNTARGNQGPATCQGSTTNASMLGGNPPSGTAIENYDGTSWTTNSTSLAGNQSQSAGFGASGDNIGVFGGGNNIAEVYSVSTNTVAAAAWATGGALNTARNGLGASGTQTAGLAAGGNTGPSKINNSEEYNGTSWTEGDNLNTARGELAAAGNSPQTAGLCFGGTTSSTPDNPGITNATEEYDGSSWTSVNNMNYSSRNLGGLGTQTSAVSAGGIGPPTYLATTGEYDGTNWTAGTSLPAGLQDNQGMTGETLTAGLLAGGEGPPGAATTSTLEYDGTNWTAGGALPTAVYGNGAAGIQGGALSFGGNSDKTATQGYDGTTWSTRPSLATGRNRVGGLGTNTAALAVGGLTNPGAVQTLTEEFTGETTSANIQDFTTS